MSKIKEIELHSGHWKNTYSGANGLLNESVENRKVVNRLFEILKSRKVPVTRFHDDVSNNQTKNINAIVKHHNIDRNGFIVAIHFNATNEKNVRRAIGVEVLYHSQKEVAAKISKAISDSTNGGLLNRGAKQNKNLGVLAKTYEPSVLIEICFVNSSIDVAIYKRDFEKICLAIANELEKLIEK